MTIAARMLDIYGSLALGLLEDFQCPVVCAHYGETVITIMFGDEVCPVYQIPDANVAYYV
jgi:hypothetical protein